MNELDALKRRIGRPLSDFREVTSLHFSKALTPDGDSDHVIEVTILTEDEEPVTALSLRCTGVRGFRVRDFGGGRARIIGFDMRSLEGRQLEGLRCEVIDYENDDMGFLCREIQVVSLGPVQGG